MLDFRLCCSWKVSWVPAFAGTTVESVVVLFPLSPFYGERVGADVSPLFHSRKRWLSACAAVDVRGGPVPAQIMIASVMKDISR